MKNQTLDIMEFLQKFIMGCREICKRYKAKKPFMTSRYGSGQKDVHRVTYSFAGMGIIVLVAIFYYVQNPKVLKTDEDCC